MQNLYLSKSIALKFLLFYFLFSTKISAQKITGKVVDNDSKKGISRVNIYIKNKSYIGTTTNNSGVYTFKVKQNTKLNDSIVFSVIGYYKYTTTIAKLNENSKVYLSKKVNTIDSFEIKGKKRQARLNFKKIGNLDKSIFSFASIIHNDKLYISGGDESFKEDTFAGAFDRANVGIPELSEKDVARELQLSTNRNFIKYSNEVLIYNLEKNIFEKPVQKLENRAYHQINYYNNKLYILGGKKATNFGGNEYLLNTIEILNLKDKTLEVDKVNPHMAINFSSFIYKDHILTLGGTTKIKKNGEKVFNNKIHLFNLKNGLWYEVGKMPNPRETSSILVNDKVYLIGGAFNKKSSKIIESFNLETNTWKKEGELFYGIKNPALTKKENSIYIYNDGKIIIYNLSENSLKEYNIGLYLKDVKIHTYKDSLIILGGVKKLQYSTEPSSAIYQINLSEFNKTKIKRVLYLNDETTSKL